MDVDSKTAPPEPTPIVAVVDSNVIIDLHSIHNIVQATRDAKDERFERLRNATLLAMCFHRHRARTYGIREAVEVLREKVPPDVVAPETHFTTGVIHFVMDNVVPGWLSEADIEHNPRGTPADHFLLEAARKSECPIITCEKKLHRVARETGVESFTPAEYWQGRIDKERETRKFLARFRSRAGPFARTMEHGRNWGVLLDMMYDFYVAVLLGRRAP